MLQRIQSVSRQPYQTIVNLLRRIKARVPEPKTKLLEDASQFWTGKAKFDALKDYSHWRGEGRWSTDKEWKGIGEKHWRMFEQLCALAGQTLTLERMAEYGPGGGPNLMRFARQFTEIYGIDISTDNLRECERQLTAAGFQGFHPILNEIETPEHCLDFVDKPVDFFLSTAVYQHFPGKEYGVRVTKIAYALLAEGGVALIQTRYDDGAEHFRSKRRDYQHNVMAFTTYSIPEFWNIAEETGFEPLAVALEPDVHYAFYFLKKRAGANS